MTHVERLRPLLCGLHRYDKSLSTRGRGRGVLIQAPILAYLVETSGGRILYDVGCDERKLASAKLRERHYGAADFPFGPPEVSSEQRLLHSLQQLGLAAADVDAVVVSHLHFDHAGGLHDFIHADIHVHAAELASARSGEDPAYFPDDFAGAHRWRQVTGDTELAPGLRMLESPGHTAGHLSL